MSNVESIEVSHRVYMLFKECTVSGNNAIPLMKFHGLGSSEAEIKKTISGKKILDVCGGVSDFTAKLLQLGADAYALDYGYQDIEELQIRARWAPSPLFKNSVRDNRQRYIFGSAHNLPFPSGSFDVITSYYGIFGAVDDDLDLAKQAINQGIDKLKPGGFMSVGPLMDGHITEKQLRNEKEVLKHLEERTDIDFSIRPPLRKGVYSNPDPLRMGRLSIVKY